MNIDGSYACSCISGYRLAADGRGCEGIPRAYRPQRRRGHVTAIVLCVPSKIQIRQWFVTNYSNSCCLDCTMHTVDFTIFSLDLNFARCLVLQV